MVAIRLPRLRLHLGLAARRHPARRPAPVAPSHGAQEPRVQLGDEADQRAPLRRDDVGVEAPVPGLDLALDEDDFRVGVCGDQVLGEGDGGRVGAHGAVVPEQLVPVGARVAGAVAEVFGVHRLVPHVAVADVGEEDGGVVAVVAEDVQGGLDCCFRNGLLSVSDRGKMNRWSISTHIHGVIVNRTTYTLYQCVGNQGSSLPSARRVHVVAGRY